MGLAEPAQPRASLARSRAGHGVLAVRFRAGPGPASAAQRAADRLRLATACRQGHGGAHLLFAEEPRANRGHRRASSAKVALGAWLDRDLQRTRRRSPPLSTSPTVIRTSSAWSSATRSILRNDLGVAELTRQLDRVRAAVEQPVSTAEPWHVWLKHPQLVEHVDYIAVHLLPYWEGIPVEQAVDYLAMRVAQLERAYPGKPVVIAEVGWPSDGRTREAAVASTSNEAMFLRRFLQRARDEGYIYYIMEAFDQPWKARYEGAVGAYWGVYDVDRDPKFAFVDPIVRIPQWQTLAAISVVLASMLLALLYVHSRTLDARGRSLLAIVVYAVTAAAVWIIYDYSQQYFTLRSVLIGGPLILGMFVVIAVLIAEAHEWAEAHWSMPRRRPFAMRCGRRGAAEGVDPRARVQRAAANADRDARCARAPRLSGLRSHRRRQQHEGRSGVAPGRAALRAARRTLPLLPRRSAAGLQGRRAQLRARAAARRTRRSSPSSTATTRSSPRGCAIWCRALRSRKSRSCRRRRTIATAAKASSRRCATRSTAASF